MEGERTGGVDDKNEVAAAAAGGGDAVGGETAGAGLGVGVRGGTREDQGRPRRRRRGHGVACRRLSPDLPTWTRARVWRNQRNTPPCGGEDEADLLNHVSSLCNGECDFVALAC